MAGFAILRDMGYPENLQKLCELRGLSQSDLAVQLGVSRASLSRILRGVQEPKLGFANQLARILDVPLDALVRDGAAIAGGRRQVELDEEEWTILQIVRRLGPEIAIDRLLGVDRGAFPPAEAEPRAIPPKG